MPAAVQERSLSVREMPAATYHVTPAPSTGQPDEHAPSQDAQLVRELREEVRRLQELQTMRAGLAQMVVHDLRTPLTALLGSLMTMDAMGGLSDEHQELLQVAVEGGNTLLGMVNDLLDISKMESGRLLPTREEVLPGDVIRCALSQVKALATARHLQTFAKIEAGLPALRADADILVRVLVNLLSNAIKFTPEHGTIRIEARRSGAEEGTLFSVTDTGEGIPREAFARIFEKFEQAGRNGSACGGSTGLGLTFCKMAVEAHGGRIWVDSRLGEGSEFSFVIPVVDEC